ncbi:hypothetical protein ACJX0J_033493, partial [Zea mays]
GTPNYDTRQYRKPVLEKSRKNFVPDEVPPTFKGRKQIENRRVVELGGKSVKKHRTPLSVAKLALKNQKKREQKKMEE